MKEINGKTTIGRLTEKEYDSLDKVSKIIYDFVAEKLNCTPYIPKGATPKTNPVEVLEAAMVYQIAEGMKHNIADTLI